MVLPNKYQVTPNPAIASYQWTDLISGAGYVSFYLCKNQTGYFLTDKIQFSDVIYFKSAELTNGTYVKEFDQLFTITLNTPRLINGSVVVNIPCNVNNVSATKGEGYLVVDFVKIVGVTETSLGTATSPTMIRDVGVINHDSYFNLNIEITNQLIKQNEKMGIRLKAYAKKTGGSTGLGFWLGFDPANRVSVIDNYLKETQSIVNIPFKILAS
jgi:hypothetical protein